MCLSTVLMLKSVNHSPLTLDSIRTNLKVPDFDTNWVCQYIMEVLRGYMDRFQQVNTLTKPFLI